MASPFASSQTSTTEDLRHSLVSSCVDIYLERVHFDIPILDCLDLHKARSNPLELLLLDPLLNYALLAVSVPWLSPSCLQQHGWLNRNEALTEAIGDFEKSRSNAASPADPTTLLQSLLLILRATTAKDVQPSAKTASWLKDARHTLSSIFSNPVQNTQESLIKRLWWACAEAEHQFFLTALLETKKQPGEEAELRLHDHCRQLLDCSSAQPPTLRDLESTLPGTYQTRVHMTQLTRWAAYLERMRLWRRMSGIIRTEPTPPRKNTTSTQARLHHDHLFWMLQELSDAFEKHFDELQGGLILGNEGDGVATAMRHENVFIYTRLVLAHLTSHKDTSPASLNGGDEALLWHGLEIRRALACVGWVVKAGEGTLAARASPWLASQMLRSLMSSIRIVQKYGTQDRPHLLRQLAGLLEACVETREQFWTAAAVDPLSAAATPTTNSTDLDHDTDAVLTPEQGPSPRWETSLGVIHESESPEGEEYLRAQECLMKSFDNMWNTHIMSTESI